MKASVNEILPLTSVRGLAAFWVLAFHLHTQLSINAWIPDGSALRWSVFGGGSNFAVELFFVLSGYILATTYRGNVRPAEFFWHRITRVVPLHWAVLTALVVARLALQRFGITPADATFFSWGSLPLQYLLVHVWLGLQGWNAPTWSLSAEMAAYACFPLLHRWTADASQRRYLQLMLAFLLLHAVLVAINGYPATGLVAIGRAIFAFSAGMMLQRATVDRPVPAALLPLSLLALAVVAMTGFYVVSTWISALLVVALAGLQRGAAYRFMTSTVAVWLGRVSFSMYLVHSPILLAFTQVQRRLPVLHETMLTLSLTVAGYLVITLVVSEMTYRWIEVPARRALRNRLRPKDTNVKVAP